MNICKVHGKVHEFAVSVWDISTWTICSEEYGATARSGILMIDGWEITKDPVTCKRCLKIKGKK